MTNALFMCYFTYLTGNSDKSFKFAMFLVQVELVYLLTRLSATFPPLDNGFVPSV